MGTLHRRIVNSGLPDISKIRIRVQGKAEHETIKTRSDEAGCDDVESFQNAARITQAIFEMRCISGAPDMMGNDRSWVKV